MIAAVSKRNVEIAQRNRGVARGARLYAPEEQLTPLQLALTNQLMNVFVGHNDDDGEFTFASAVGAYCVRLYKRGLFVPLIVDDLFPMLRRDEWTTENRGMAVARAKECSALWVSLIEKVDPQYLALHRSTRTTLTALPLSLPDLSLPVGAPGVRQVLRQLRGDRARLRAPRAPGPHGLRERAREPPAGQPRQREEVALGAVAALLPQRLHFGGRHGRRE